MACSGLSKVSRKWHIYTKFHFELCTMHKSSQEMNIGEQEFHLYNYKVDLSNSNGSKVIQVCICLLLIMLWVLLHKLLTTLPVWDTAIPGPVKPVTQRYSLTGWEAAGSLGSVLIPTNYPYWVSSWPLWDSSTYSMGRSGIYLNLEFAYVYKCLSVDEKKFIKFSIFLTLLITFYL